MRCLLLLTLLVASQAWAATKYFDSTCAAPGDGSSPVCSGSTAPYDQFSDATVSAGDMLMCTGEFREQLSLTNVASITVWPYGAGCVINGQGSRDYALLADRTSGLVVGALELKNALKNGAKVFNTTFATTVRGIKFDRTVIHDNGPGIYPAVNEAEFEVGTGLLIRTDSSSSAIIDGVTLLGVKSYRNGKHGMDFRFQVRNVLVDGFEVYENGATATAHGLSIHPWKVTVTGWTDVDGGGAGTIYSRARLSVNDQEQLMIDQTNKVVLAKNTATPTTPGINEWGIDSTTLYCNIGAAGCSAVTVALKRYPHGPFRIQSGYAHDNYSGVDSAEGHGLDADDLTGPATFIGNLSEKNQGNGLMTFYGEGVDFIGNISRDNARTGLLIYLCTTCSAISNTLDGNGDLGLYDSGVKTTGLKAKNNALTLNATRGGSVTAGTAGDAGFSSSNNFTFGNVANNGCINLTCSATNPGYARTTSRNEPDAYCLETGDAALGAGVYVGPWATGYGREDLGNPPVIGARATCEPRRASAQRRQAGTRRAVTARRAAAERRAL
jgi:hypothetical protein